MRFCDYLKEMRLAAGYTQQEIADILQVDRSTYAYYEAGKTEPNIPKLKRIANMYGISLDDLVERRLRPVPLQFSASRGGNFAALQALRRLSDDEQNLVLLYRSFNDKAGLLRHIRDFQDKEDMPEEEEEE